MERREIPGRLTGFYFVPGLRYAPSGLRCDADRYLTASSSTSNNNVALGGMTPPAPRAP